MTRAVTGDTQVRVQRSTSPSLESQGRLLRQDIYLKSQSIEWKQLSRGGKVVPGEENNICKDPEPQKTQGLLNFWTFSYLYTHTHF